MMATTLAERSEGASSDGKTTGTVNLTTTMLNSIWQFHHATLDVGARAARRCGVAVGLASVAGDIIAEGCTVRIVDLARADWPRGFGSQHASRSTARPAPAGQTVPRAVARPVQLRHACSPEAGVASTRAGGDRNARRAGAARTGRHHWRREARAARRALGRRRRQVRQGG